MNPLLICSPLIFRENIEKFGGMKVFKRAFTRLKRGCLNGSRDCSLSVRAIEQLALDVLNKKDFNVLDYLDEYEEAVLYAKEEYHNAIHKTYVVEGDIYDVNQLREYSMLQYVRSALKIAVEKAKARRCKVMRLYS